MVNGLNGVTVSAATREVTNNSYSPHSPPLPCPIQLPYPVCHALGRRLPRCWIN
ncbi:MAG: hypothetical protein QN423_12555 [Nitrososphaeraceae archaeon]|nr:hypothetical protein [Nitrososphaeraceae archaeon]